jgi:hypothetical protein
VLLRPVDVENWLASKVTTAAPARVDEPSGGKGAK